MCISLNDYSPGFNSNNLCQKPTFNFINPFSDKDPRDINSDDKFYEIGNKRIHVYNKIHKSEINKYYTRHFNKWKEINSKFRKELNQENKYLISTDDYRSEIKENFKAIKGGDFKKVSDSIKKTKEHIKKGDSTANDLKNADIQFTSEWYKDSEKLNKYFDSYEYLAELFENPIFKTYGDLPNYNQNYDIVNPSKIKITNINNEQKKFLIIDWIYGKN